MPTDPAPGVRAAPNRPRDKPLGEPNFGETETDERTPREQAEVPESLVSPDMEEPAETNRPPLGN